MRKFTLFLMSLLLTVGAMAQDYLIKNKVTEVKTGYYVVVGTFNPNNGGTTSTGPAYYEKSLGDCKYRLDVDKTIVKDESLSDANYVWYVENNGTTITLKNLQDDVYFVRDVAKNKNFQGSETANLTLEKISQDATETKFFMHLADYTDIGYIHCNAPGGDPCLSYWPSHGVRESTAVRFEFFEVEVDEQVLIELQSKITDFQEATTTFGTYSGSINDIINGNKNDKWWSNENQAVGKDITIVLNSVHQVGTIKCYFCDGDQPKGATLERRATDDGEWINVADFTIDDIENNIFTCTAEGADVKELRLRITENVGKWFQVAEVELYEYIEVDKTGLQDLIAEAEDLYDRIVVPEKVVGDAINIAGKITSNAAQNNADGNSGATDDGAGIAGLTDNNINTYFHSRWGGVAIYEDHYLQIDLGENNNLSDFCFSYSVRKGENANQTSPAPTTIEVRVSEDGTDFGEPFVTFTKDDNNLPAYTDLGSTLWSSGVISVGKSIRYVRLTVADSQGPGNTEWEGHNFFAMSALNLYSVNEVKVLNEAYRESISSDLFEAYCNALNAAKTVYEDNTALPSAVQNAKEALEEQFSAINDVIEVRSYTLSVTNAGWATLYLGYNALIPDFTKAGDDAGAYIVTGVKDGWLTMEKVVGVLPENTGIIVKANEDDYVFNYAAEATIDVQRNLLQGSVVDLKVEGAAYVLGYAEDTTEVVFGKAKMNGTYWLNKAYKAYLPVSALPASLQSNSLRFDFGTTAIEEVETENAEAEVIYDLTGRRVNQITKAGVYIIGGRKVLVK